MSQYLGVDVLDAFEPNRSGPLDVSHEQSQRRFDAATGIVIVSERWVHPKPVRSVVWTAMGRPEAAVMRAFMDARRGRQVPFWLPSYQNDLTLAEALATTSNLAVIDWIGYREEVWLAGGRRHIAFMAGGTLAAHAITGSSHTPGAATENLTIDPGSMADHPAGTAIAFLRYVRLEDDALEYRWRGDTCQVSFRVRELPQEEP